MVIAVDFDGTIVQNKYPDIGEEIPWKELSLLHLAYYLLQLELAAICFGISAFMRRGSVGAGLGVAALMYFVNINID